jgi:D-ribose pyranase
VKRGGILHPGVSHLLASTGHTDYFTVCDRGFPVPIGPERIDLALVDGIPTVIDVLSAIHAEFTIDRIVVAGEAETASPAYVEELRELIAPAPVVTMPHLELKELSRDGRATIRTGDVTPYANILIVSG